MDRTSPSPESILAGAAEIPDPAAREAFLDRACGGDAGLRDRLGRMVADLLAAGDFLEPPAGEVTADHPSGSVGAGAVIGPYRLLEPIGEGGMGLVFVARQQEPVRREVALKVIRPGMDSRQVVARFEAERQALALMDHPNIAKIFDGGTTPDGRPFFVMELVRGTPVTDYCDEHRLTVRDRLGVFLQVCAAVQHAHQKGVIHRDLKPSNVLVAVHDVDPVAKVIDFGIAKALGPELTDKTLHTGFAQMVGTPLYMSPEQAGESSLDVDTRTDVYALGVILYELLTGTTPIDPASLRGAGFVEVRRAVREGEAARPSARLSTLDAAARSTAAGRRSADPRKLAAELRGELDWVAMKCLEKDRNRRYETVAALAEDIRRYLADEPVQARPPSVWYRTRKFARRHRAGVGVGLAVLAVVLAFGLAAADRGGRRSATGRAVEDALAESIELQTQGKYPAALQAARRAEGLAVSGSAAWAVRDRAARRRADLELVLRLGEVRLEMAAAVDVRRNEFDTGLADRRYGEEFRAAGIDLDGLPAEAAAGRLRATSVATEVVAVVDDWTIVRRRFRGGADPGWRQLFEVTRLADPDPWRCRLREALAAKDRAALEALAAVGDQPAQPAASVVTLALGLQLVGATDRAVEVLLAVHRRHPADFWVNHALGEALSHQPGQLAETLRFYTAAVALRPESPGARVNLGYVLERLGRWDEGAAAYREAIRLRPDYPAAHSGLGKVLREKGDLDGALACFREAVRLDPGYAIAHNNLGAVLAANGAWDGALVCFREAVRLDPKYALAHHNLGNALSEKGDRDGALACYREAVRLDPGFAPAHHNLGRSLHEKGDLDGAIAAYREAVRLDPKFAAAHHNLGAALLAKGDRDGGVACLREEVRLDPKFAPAHYYLGNALLAKGDRDGAISCYREAVRLDPGFAPAHYNLGTSLLAKGDRDGALVCFRKAVQLDWKFAAAHNDLAWLLATCPDPKFRDPAGAVAAARRAVELAPKNGGHWNTLGVALYRAGEWKEAAGALEKSVELGKGGGAHDFFFLAMAHWQLGDRGKAGEWFRRGVEWMDRKAPADPELRRFRAEAAELIGVLAPPPRPVR